MKKLINKIIDQFYNGNWSDGVKNMLEIFVNPHDIAEYIDNQIEEGSIDGSFFDRSSIATIASIYYEIRNNQ